MIEVDQTDPELAALLDAEVPNRVGGTREFSVTLHELFGTALAPHAGHLGGSGKLALRAFVFSNMVNALGHALVLRRPHGLSLRGAKAEACTAILASLNPERRFNRS